MVVGGGVVGLACARSIAKRGGAGSVLLLEAASSLGSESSSRNSGVIHAGLYYPQGSLKGSLCVRGRRMLYQYCKERAIPHTNCGKLVVSTNSKDDHKLLALLAAARCNGLSVTGVALISAAEAKALEPNVVCTAALHSRVTGAVCASSLVASLEHEFCNELLGTVVLNCRVEGGTLHSTVGSGRSSGRSSGSGWGSGSVRGSDVGPIVLKTSLGPIACDVLINAAGLAAQSRPRATGWLAGWLTGWLACWLANDGRRRKREKVFVSCVPHYKNSTTLPCQSVPSVRLSTRTRRPPSPSPQPSG